MPYHIGPVTSIGPAPLGPATVTAEPPTPPSRDASKPKPRLASARPDSDPSGISRARPPKRPAIPVNDNPDVLKPTAPVELTAAERMEKLNAQQEKMAILSAEMQNQAANRSEMLQQVRDFTRDAKDASKDVGEAGHKPT